MASSDATAAGIAAAAALQQTVSAGLLLPAAQPMIASTGKPGDRCQAFELPYQLSKMLPLP